MIYFDVETETKFKRTESSKHVRYKGYLMVMISAVIWGLSGNAAQILFQFYKFNPGWLITVRMGFSGLLLLTVVTFGLGFSSVVAIWKKPKDVFHLFLFSIFGMLGVQYSYFASIQLGNAVTATLLQYLGPVFITIYFILRFRKIPTIWEFFAVVLAITGIFLLVTNGNWHGLSVSTGAVIWGLISAFSLAFYTTFPQKLIGDYGSATIIGWAMLIGSIGLWFWTPPWHVKGHSTMEAWILVFFIVLFGTAVTFYLYLASLNYITPLETGLLACVEPLSATIVATVFINVRIGPTAMVGGAFILITVIILARFGRYRTYV